MAVAENSAWWVFWIVAVARFLVPLTIPRYPLPGILAALVLDAADQTIFQQFPGLDLEGYQGYDKALDIYYLTIAYIATLRNWENLFAFQVSRFLFYWRLAGVALFELTQLRALLLVFPNTFEYFFIFYEAYRVRWDPTKMSKKLIIGAAAVIWIVIKLPQETWIHIVQIDTTDWIKTGLFGVPADTGWVEIVQGWPLVFVAVFVVLVLILVGAWWLLRRLPPADRRLAPPRALAVALSADAHQPAFTTEQVRDAVASEARHIVDAALVEKVILISLVSVCFAQVLPGVQATSLQLAVGVGLIVVLNTALSHWLARRGYGAAFALRQFAVLGVVNLALIMAYAVLQARFDHRVNVTNVLFFIVLLTLLVTLYDHYRQVYLMRFGERGRSRWE
jgi:hypothetical protein